MLNNSKNKSILFFILAIFIILQSAYLLFPADLWWDASVYLGMGKYLFSAGKSGLWEPSRPLAWPIVLGILWKTGANPVLLGSIITIFLSAGCIMLTYLISKSFFDDDTSLIAALFIAFSPTFFLFTSVLQSEIPSLFLLLLGAYFFLRKKLITSGIIFGVSFMTRFFIIFAIIPFFAELVISSMRKKSSSKLLAFMLPFLATLSVYLISNETAYPHIFYPFMLQLFMTKATGIIFSHPLSFYLIGLFKENILLIFAILGIYYLTKKRNAKNILFFSIIIFSFVPFALTPHKEMRFLLPLLPFLYMAAAHGIIFFSRNLKFKKIIIIPLIVIWAIFTFPNLKFNQYHDNLAVPASYLMKENPSGQIWTSNPLYSIYLDKKIDELMYYQTFDHEKFLHLKNNIQNAGSIFLGTCDLYCEPYNSYCESDKKELVDLLKGNFKTLYYRNEKECESFVFSR